MDFFDNHWIINMTHDELLSILTAAATFLSSIAAIFAVFVSYSTHQSQKLLSQRQLLVPLWSYISSLDDIDPTPGNIITPSVIKAMNTLELIALCCEGGMIDPIIIRRTFRHNYLHIFDQIQRCGILPGTTKDGPKLISENRAAELLYIELKKEHLQSDRPTTKP